MYTCPICGYKTFSEPPGGYEICPVCGWEDDVAQLRFVESIGANKVSLIEAQQNFKVVGTSDPAKAPRAPIDTSIFERDPQWRPFDAIKDKIETPNPDVDYGNTYPSESTTLYYW